MCWREEKLGEKLELIDYSFLLDVDEGLEFFSAPDAEHPGAVDRNCNHITSSLSRLNLHEGYFFLSHFRSLSTTINHNIYRVYCTNGFNVVEKPHKR